MFNSELNKILKTFSLHTCLVDFLGFFGVWYDRLNMCIFIKMLIGHGIYLEAFSVDD